jgi:hypothetical protein
MFLLITILNKLNPLLTLSLICFGSRILIVLYIVVNMIGALMKCIDFWRIGKASLVKFIERFSWSGVACIIWANVACFKSTSVTYK